jgi:hypothetical protein
MALLQAADLCDAERPWPWQVHMYDAGVYLHDHPMTARVGSWNAGIIGYYQGGSVVNIDGLVNNDIYPYAAGNDLAAYWDRKAIRYVVDFDEVVDEPKYRRRNGCLDRCRERLQLAHVFYRGADGALNLYTVR